MNLVGGLTTCGRGDALILPARPRDLDGLPPQAIGSNKVFGRIVAYVNAMSAGKPPDALDFFECPCVWLPEFVSPLVSADERMGMV